MSRLCIAFICLLSLGTIGGCSKPDSVGGSKTPQSNGLVVQQTPIFSKDQFGALGQEYLSATRLDGGICPVDNLNRQSKGVVKEVRRADPFGISGWFVIETKERPVPPIIFAVLEGSSGTYYLEGRRMSRPDVAKGDALLEMAGYEVEGYLSNVIDGTYELTLLTGDKGTLIRCRTDVDVVVK